MRDTAETISASLLEQQDLCRKIHQLVEEEGQDLRYPSSESDSSRTFDFYQQRKLLLPQLDDSLDQIRRHRVWWQQLTAQDRKHHPEIAALIRANQDLIMKIICHDQENEKFRLRQGLLPPKALPSSQTQRPNFVADLYKKHSLPPASAESFPSHPFDSDPDTTHAT